MCWNHVDVGELNVDGPVGMVVEQDQEFVAVPDHVFNASLPLNTS